MRCRWMNKMQMNEMLMDKCNADEHRCGWIHEMQMDE